MSFKFSTALVRKPSSRISKAISSKNLKPDYNKVINEHKKYVSALIQSGLNIHVLEALEEYPDSVFIEDPVLAYKDISILLRPGAKTRLGEIKELEEDTKKLFEQTFFIKEGKIEGGDILRINDHFIIGLSERTNIKGAENLSSLLTSLGASVEISSTPEGVLHFKSDCSLIDEETILLTKRMSNIDIFSKKFKIIEVPEGEEIAANTLRINNNLLIPKGFEKIQEKLSKNFNLIILDINEVSKVDAGLSCMSIRW